MSDLSGMRCRIALAEGLSVLAACGGSVRHAGVRASHADPGEAGTLVVRPEAPPFRAREMSLTESL